MKLYTKYKDDYTDIQGEQQPEMCGWWILSTDGTEVWDVVGPFDTEEKAELRKAEIESWVQ
jgi:hypothetical protein